MHCETCQLLVYDFVDGKLSAAEAEQVQAHVSSCPECREYLKDETNRLKLWPMMLKSAVAKGKVRVSHLKRFDRQLGIARRNAQETPPETKQDIDC